MLTGQQPPSRPNIIVFLADNQGWGDLGITGNTNLSTPRIDSIGRDGAILQHFYVSPVCAPTRAELLTGRYYPRGGVYGTSARAERLNLDEKTIADALKAAGYATGAFGKWHNGSQSPYHPNARGFDEFSAKAHQGQQRRNGDPYISHPVAVAEILAGLHLDSGSIKAALLHDVVEDTANTLPEIQERFGDESRCSSTASARSIS